MSMGDWHRLRMVEVNEPMELKRSKGVDAGGMEHGS